MNEHLIWRYTTKRFDPSRQVSENDLAELLDVLRLAPSSFGLQPWKFVIVRDPRLRDEIRNCAWGQPQVREASHLIIFCALTHMDEGHVSRYISHVAQVRGVPRGSLSDYERGMQEFLRSRSSQEMSEWMKRQVYIALGMFLDECARKKIDASPMEGFDSSKVDELLGLNAEGVTSVVLCPIGYRAKDDRYAGLTKVRFDSSEIFIQR